jgi:predicted nucleotidyltransferase
LNAAHIRNESRAVTASSRDVLRWDLRIRDLSRYSEDIENAAASTCADVENAVGVVLARVFQGAQVSLG